MNHSEIVSFIWGVFRRLYHLLCELWQILKVLWGLALVWFLRFVVLRLVPSWLRKPLTIREVARLGLKRRGLRERLSSRLGEFFRRRYLWFVAPTPFLLLVVLATAPRTSSMLASALAHLSNDVIEGIADSALIAVAALVGVVVPMAVLVFNLLTSRVGDTLARVAVQRMGHPLVPLTVGVPLLVALVTVGPLLNASWFPATWGRLSIVTLWVLFVFLTFLVLRLLLIVTRSTDRKWLLNRVSSSVNRSVRWAVRSEAEARAVEAEFDRLFDYQRSAHGMHSKGELPRIVASGRRGIIDDFFLCVSHSGRYTGRVAYDAATVTWRVRPGSTVEDGAPLANLVQSTESRPKAWLMSKSVRIACRLRRSAPSDSIAYRQVSALLAALKDEAVQRIDGNREGEFREVLDVLLEVVNQYLSIAEAAQLRFRPDQLSAFLGGFYITHILHELLRDIIEACVRQKDRVHVGIVSHALNRILREAVSKRDLMVFNLGVKLQVFLYWTARQGVPDGTAKIAIHRSRHNLIDRVDFQIFDLLQETEDPLAAYDYVQFLLLVVEGLESLLYHVLSTRDSESLPDFQRALNELLHGWGRYEMNLTDTPGLADEVREEMPSVISSEIQQAWLNACSYLANKILRASGRLGFEIDTLAKIHSQFPDLDSLVTAVGNRLGRHTGWDVWEEVPDTKKVTWSDERQRVLAFYIVRAIELIREGKTLPDKLPKALLFAIDLMEQVATLVASAENLWTSEPSAEEELADFINLHRTCRANAEQARRIAVMNADVSPEMVAALHESFAAEYSATGGLRQFLIKELGVHELPEDVGDSPELHRHALYPKELFVKDLQEVDPDPVIAIGKDLGRTWRRIEDAQMLEQVWKAAGSEVIASKGKALSALGRAIEEMRSKGSEPDVVILSRRHWIDLMRASQYEPASEEKVEQRGFEGRFHDVPVLLKHGLGSGVLIFAPQGALTIRLSEPVLRTLTGENVLVRVRTKGGIVQEPAVDVEVLQKICAEVSDAVRVVRLSDPESGDEGASARYPIVSGKQ